MSHLTILAFEDKYKAEEALGVLRQLEREGLGQIDEAVVLIRGEDGKFKPLRGFDEAVPRAATTAGGGGLGLILGAVVSLPVPGAVTGGVLVHRLIANTQQLRTIRQFSESLPLGSSVVFISGQSTDLKAILNQLQPLLVNATLLHTDLPDDLLAQVQAVMQPSATTVSTPDIRRILAIINPVAGESRPILKPLNQALRPADITWEVAITQQSGDAHRFATQAVSEGFDAVAIYGGDGSVMEAASGLVGTGVPLAIIPGGTGDAMAIELGIPKDVAGAASLLTREQVIVRNVDLGQVGERYFLLRLCTGYEAEHVKETSREAKERLSSLAYGLSMVKQELKQVSYQLTLDGEEVEVTGYSCMVANSGNFGLSDYPILSNISVSDGLLDVVIVQNLNFLSMLRDRNRTDEQHQFIRHWQVHEATIATEPSQTVVGDGEIWEDTPFTARVVPSAVRIIVP